MRIAHIGLPKTASTFLQLNYFSKFKGSFFSTKDPFQWPNELKFVYLLNKEVEKHYKDWGKHDELLIHNKIIEKKLNYMYIKHKIRAKSFANSNKSIPRIILSSEGLYGINNKVNYLQMKLLKYCSIEKVIFIIRNQSDWLESFWNQIIVKEDRFSKYIEADYIFSSSEESIGYSLNWLDYVKSIINVFGQENVLVLPYEMLVNNPMFFFERLNQFIGLNPEKQPDFSKKINISIRPLTYKASFVDDLYYIGRIRYVRKLIRKLSNLSPLNNNLIDREIKINFSKDLFFKVKNKYSKSNKELEKLLNIELSAYNYY
tara:strand:- start:1310 stop:2257 length:948 start_codon:yes stop_codon:yes gene_type:complete